MTDGNPQQGGAGDEREPTLPEDEEAAWAAIVAGYGEYPSEVPDEHLPAGHPPDDSERRGAVPDGAARPARADADDEEAPDAREIGDVRDDAPRSGTTDNRIRSFTVYPAGAAPRDWQPPHDHDDDHFTPPEPPPLPETDTATKCAWAGALGGPVLLVGAVLFGVPLSWWILTLGIGGFLAGFATLLTGLRDDDDEDPGGGAVV